MPRWRSTLRDRLERADDPEQVTALATLWVLFVVGTAAFALLDATWAAISLSYWQLLPVAVLLVVASVIVLDRQ